MPRGCGRTGRTGDRSNTKATNIDDETATSQVDIADYIGQNKRWANKKHDHTKNASLASNCSPNKHNRCDELFLVMMPNNCGQNTSKCNPVFMVRCPPNKFGLVTHYNANVIH